MSVRLRIVSYVVALGVALGIVLGSLFSINPDAVDVRLLAAGCSVILLVGLVLQLRRLS